MSEAQDPNSKADMAIESAKIVATIEAASLGTFAIGSTLYYQYGPAQLAYRDEQCASEYAPTAPYPAVCDRGRIESLFTNNPTKIDSIPIGDAGESLASPRYPAHDQFVSLAATRSKEMHDDRMDFTLHAVEAGLALATVAACVVAVRKVQAMRGENKRAADIRAGKIQVNPKAGDRPPQVVANRSTPAQRELPPTQQNPMMGRTDLPRPYNPAASRTSAPDLEPPYGAGTEVYGDSAEPTERVELPADVTAQQRRHPR